MSLGRERCGGCTVVRLVADDESTYDGGSFWEYEDGEMRQMVDVSSMRGCSHKLIDQNQNIECESEYIVCLQVHLSGCCLDSGIAK